MLIYLLEIMGCDRDTCLCPLFVLTPLRRDDSVSRLRPRLEGSLESIASMFVFARGSLRLWTDDDFSEREGRLRRLTRCSSFDARVSYLRWFRLSPARLASRREGCCDDDCLTVVRLSRTARLDPLSCGFSRDIVAHKLDERLAISF